VSVSVQADKPVVRIFGGFGVEWDPKFWTMGTFKIHEDFTGEVKVTEKDWDLVVRRLAWMHPPVVRMMVCCPWLTAGDGKFHWDTRHMRSLYRHLDVCQKLGIDVILSDWGTGWAKSAGFTGHDDPNYAQAVGTYLNVLINDRKYDCIKYFVLGNEPNYDVKDYARWKAGVQNVAEVLIERKLAGRVTLLGSDAAHDEDWHRRTVDDLHAVLGGYDIHRYAPVAEVRTGKLQAYIRQQWDYARKMDANATGKPMVVGEAGVNAPGFSASQNPLHMDFSYGLQMADCACQAANGGSTMVLAWMLDDSSHAGFTWGMWRNKEGGFALKPWFYTWSLLTRLFPAAGSIVETRLRSSDVRAMTMRLPRDAGWSFCAVNRDGQPVTLKLRIPPAGKLTMQRYIYARDAAKADSDGFPVPAATQEVDLVGGAAVACPAESVVFLTTRRK